MDRLHSICLSVIIKYPCSFDELFVNSILYSTFCYIGLYKLLNRINYRATNSNYEKLLDNYKKFE